MLSERYRPIETLSADRFGETYLSEDLNHPDRSRCILKRLKLPGKNPQSLNLLLVLLKKKAESLKALKSCPHLPRLLNYSATSSSFYWVEEFIEGHLLSEEFIPGQPQSEEAVIQLLKDILEILAAIHDAGFIHGRLKPSNLIRRDRDERLILIGLNPFKEICDRARRSQGRSVEPKLNGSALYIAPEQDQGTAQFNSDLYALGMLAVVALTGSSSTELSTLLSEQSAPAETRAWRNGIPLRPTFGKILDRAIHPDSQQRYQLATEILADLAKVDREPLDTAMLAGAPPQRPAKPTAQRVASPPTITPSPRKVPLKAIAIAAAIAGLLGLAVGMRWPQTFTSTYLQRQALNAKNRNRREQALQYYDRALELQPRNAQIYINRGLLKHELGKTADALEDLTRALELGSRSSDAYYNRGNLRLQLGDDRGAISDYTEALRLDPHNTAAYINRGSARSHLGDEENAVSDYTKALEKLTDSSPAGDHRSIQDRDKNIVAAYSNRCLSRLNLGDRPGAIEDCTQAINRQPTYTFAYQNRGLARRQSGDKSGAIDDFNTAIKLDPEDPEPYYNRGLVRQDLGDTTGAIEDFSAAIARNPEHILAYYDRGIARRQNGDRSGAIADWERASTLCLEVGLLNCYQDAQYQLEQLKGNNS